MTDNINPLTPAPQSSARDIPVTRHDGWTGERMATFCEVLAETGIVEEACLAAGKSRQGADAARRRNPTFAAAWQAALGMARERLADGLLARSIEGCVERYYKDGELVGEKRHIDNRLGLAILRRLDRIAETGAATVAPSRSAGRTPASLSLAIDWDAALDALRSEDEEMAARALATTREGDEVAEVAGPPDSSGEAGIIGPPAGKKRGRVWMDEEGQWTTDYPPPRGVDLDRPGYYQKGEWGSVGYERDCTPEECEILDAEQERTAARRRAREEAARDARFDLARGRAQGG
jgi:hypothetical protein